MKGTKFRFPSISVGATENAILAAVQAKGITIIDNCAIEPEIKDLINFEKLGVKIKIKGRKITIEGSIVEKISHNIICDRIELGTYLIGALSAKKLRLKNIDTSLVKKKLIY